MSNDLAQETLDIFARRILAKAELLQMQEVFQENYSTAPAPLGTKAPLKLYIINHGAVETAADTPNISHGFPVKCLKLCKRILDGDPRNTILCTQKSRVSLNFELVLIVEYEDDTFDVLTLPRDLSAFTQYNASTTKAFVDTTVLDPTAGTPVVQHQNVTQPYEQMVIKYNSDATAYANFEYTVTIPLSSFSAALRKCELNDPTLQSYIVLRNLTPEVDVLDQYLARAKAATTIWTTVVEFSLSEDIIDKLGIDQDIQIVGTPEYVCQDTTCDCC